MVLRHILCRNSIFFEEFMVKIPTGLLKTIRLFFWKNFLDEIVPMLKWNFVDCSIPLFLTFPTFVFEFWIKLHLKLYIFLCIFKCGKRFRYLFFMKFRNQLFNFEIKLYINRACLVDCQLSIYQIGWILDSTS